MSLSLSLIHPQGPLTLRLEMQLGPRVTALFGPSGSGKSTILDLIAGLKTPQQGRITLGERVLFDSDARINLAPHKRRIGYVFQDARLFPHLSPRKNLLYAARPNSPLFDPVVEVMGLAPLLERPVSALSGGERQRVAIGRALLSEPELLLMDEPLAALDEALKAEILPYIAELCRKGGPPILYVSHARDEIAQLADQLLLLQNGQLAPVTTPQAAWGPIQ